MRRQKLIILTTVFAFLSSLGLLSVVAKQDHWVDMIKVVQQVEQPCLGFKILAAGRMCHDKNSVAEAFKFAYKHLKPTDGVIVGMYPRYDDQIRQNAQYTLQFGLLRGT